MWANLVLHLVGDGMAEARMLYLWEVVGYVWKEKHEQKKGIPQTGDAGVTDEREDDGRICGVETER